MKATCKNFGVYAALLLAAWVVCPSAAVAQEVPPVPDHLTYIFPAYFPKNNQGDYSSSGMTPGDLRNLMGNYYEGWWREASYHRANPTNGLSERGFFMDTKTVGEVALPWPMAPGDAVQGEEAIADLEVGVASADLDTVYTGVLDPVPVGGRSIAFQIGSRIVSSATGHDGLGGDGVGTINMATGAYSFKLNLPAPDGTPILVSYTGYIMGAAPSPANWANFSQGLVDFTGIDRIPDGRGEHFMDDESEEGVAAVRYPRWSAAANAEISQPLPDGFWTPGERFTDRGGANPPNGRWDPYQHAEDRWTPAITNWGVVDLYPTNNVIPDILRTFINSPERGDFFADYNFSILEVDEEGRVIEGEFSPNVNVTIQVADRDQAVNIATNISEFNLTPLVYIRSQTDEEDELFTEDSWVFRDRDWTASGSNMAASLFFALPEYSSIVSQFGDTEIGGLIADYTLTLPVNTNAVNAAGHSRVATSTGLALTNAAIYVADFAAGTNRLLSLPSLDLTPPRYFTNFPSGVLGPDEDRWEPEHDFSGIANAATGIEHLGSIRNYLSALNADGERYRGDALLDYGFNYRPSSSFWGSTPTNVGTLDVTIYVADTFLGTNRSISMQQMDLTPPIFYINTTPVYGSDLGGSPITVDTTGNLEGDAAHHYISNDPATSFTNVPFAERFEVNFDTSGQPAMVDSGLAITTRVYVANDLYTAATSSPGAEVQWPYSGLSRNRFVYDGTRVQILGTGSDFWSECVETGTVTYGASQWSELRIPMYHAEALWGEPSNTNTLLNSFYTNAVPPAGRANPFVDAVGSDDVWTPGQASAFGPTVPYYGNDGVTTFTNDATGTLEGDVAYTYEPGTDSIYTNIPAIGRFEYQLTSDGLPLVYLNHDSFIEMKVLLPQTRVNLLRANPGVAFQGAVYNPAQDRIMVTNAPGTTASTREFGNYIRSAGSTVTSNSVSLQYPAHVQIPVFYARGLLNTNLLYKNLWGAPVSTNYLEAAGSTNLPASGSVDSRFRDTTPVLYGGPDDQWTPPIAVLVTNASNRVFHYSRLDAAVTNNPAPLLGDASWTYVRDNTADPPNLRPTYEDIPALGRIEFNTGHIYKAPPEYDIIIETQVDLPQSLIDQMTANEGQIIQGFMITNSQLRVPYPPEDFFDSDFVADDTPNTNPDLVRRRAFVHVPVYYSAAIWGAPGGDYLAHFTNVNAVLNPFSDAVGGDGEWTPAIQEEFFTDFIPIWDPVGGEDGNSGIWVPGIEGVPGVGTLPRGSAPNEFYWTWDQYTAYIRNNYPGLPEAQNALINRSLNGVYDGPENWLEVANNHMIQNGYNIFGPSVMPGFWDFEVGPENIKSYEDWWLDRYGSTPAYPPVLIPNITEWNPELTDDTQTYAVSTNVTTNVLSGLVVTNLVYGDLTRPPFGTTWTYDAPREFDDLPSSLHVNGELGAESVRASINFGLQNPAAIADGGDLRLGEVTSPWSDAIWGQDRGDDDPTSALVGSPDRLLRLAGPYAYNVYGNFGYDAANLLNLEYATHRTDGQSLTGPRGGHRMPTGYNYLDAPNLTGYNQSVKYARDHRDVNLNGLIDQGETIPAGSMNYLVDPIATSLDNGRNNLQLFGWARMIEHLISIYDAVEDFSEVSTYTVPGKVGDSDIVIQAPGGYRFQDGTLATGTLYSVVGAPILWADLDGSGDYTPGRDVLWIDYTSNGVYNALEELIQNPNLLLDAEEEAAGSGPYLAEWADLDGNAEFDVGEDLAWMDTWGDGTVGVYDSEMILTDPQGILQSGVRVPANKRNYDPAFAVDRNIYVYPSMTNFQLMWAVTNNYAGATDNYGGTNGLNEIYRDPEFLFPSGITTGVLWDASDIANYPGDVRFATLDSTRLSFQPGDAVFVDENGNGEYDGDTVVSTPLTGLLRAYIGTNSFDSFDIAYTTNSLGDYDRVSSAVWIETFAPADRRNGDRLLTPPLWIVDGDAGVDVSAYIQWIDQPIGTNAPNGSYDEVRVISGEDLPYSILGDVYAGDVLFYDRNINGIFNIGATVVRPVYMAPLYNQVGVPPQGIFTSGHRYESATRDGRVLSGFSQVEPVASQPGLLTHEQAHDLLNWPDLYDYDRFSEEVMNFPVANTDLMSGGGLVHGYPDLKFRRSRAGEFWPKFNAVDPQELNDLLTPDGTTKTIKLYPVERIPDQYYVFRKPGATHEFFTIAYNAGPQASPYANPVGRGVMITKSDYEFSEYGMPLQQRSNNRFTWQVVPADNNYDPHDGIGGFGPEAAFGNTPETRVFTAHTRPAAIWWDGSDSGLRILDIRIPEDPFGAAEVDLQWVPIGTGIATNFPIHYDVPPGLDTDGDGIPDAWEYFWFSNYPDPLAVMGIGTDYDLDGLSDYYEWLAGSDPKSQVSWLDPAMNPDGLSDADLDIDGDGLQNSEEELRGTHPRLPDTADNGYLDGSPDDIQPSSSLEPLVDRVLWLDGAPDSYVEMPDQDRFALREFTLQAWVNPSVGGGDIFARQVQPGAYNYRMRLRADRRVEFSFTPATLAADIVLASPAGQELATNEWTHVAGTFDPATGYLRIFLNGVPANAVKTGSRPAVSAAGPSWTRIGAGFAGMMDEVLVAGNALEQSEIFSLRTGVAKVGVTSNTTHVAYYRFEDGTSATGPDAQRRWYGTSMRPDWYWGQVEDFAATEVPVQEVTTTVDESGVTNTVTNTVMEVQRIFAKDWMYSWRNAGTLVGNVAMTNAPDNAPVRYEDLDSNGDGIPDWWYLLYGYDPAGESVAKQDWDGDGLNNYGEYLVGSDPNNAYSADPSNALNDGDYDSDGDGLSNADEINIFGTRPDRWDTDDDGFSDGDEVDATVLSGDRYITSPTYSRSPVIQRSLVLHGTAVTVPSLLATGEDRFNVPEWTIEGWFRPDTAAETGSLIRRVVSANQQTAFELYLTNNIPSVRFQTGAGQWVVAGGSVAIPAGEWTHLAGVWNPRTYSLELYVNGVSYRGQTSLVAPVSGFGTTVMGAGVSGRIDEARIWSLARSASDIALSRDWFGPASALAGGGAVDIVFLIDVSGSMGGPIDTVKAGVTDFVNQFAERGINAQVAGVRYSDTLEGGGGGDTPPDGAGFFGDGESFLTEWLDPLPLQGGGDWAEDGLGALTYALDSGNFDPTYRSGAQKVFVLVTDAPVKDTEDGDTGAVQSRASVIAALKAAGVVVHAVRTPGTPDVEEIVESTGGLLFDIGVADYSPIFDTIAATVTGGGGEGDLLAWYPFDDGGEHAEDYRHPLDWRFALSGISSNDFDAVEYMHLLGEIDTDGDSLPDWWERLFASSVVSTNTTTNTTAEAEAGAEEDAVDEAATLMDASEDTDGDGLNNLYEYWADTNPLASDTDNDGILDRLEDPDEDGLQNHEEQRRGTHPRLTDTDDDGLKDGDAADLVPSSSLLPMMDRVLELDGATNSYVQMPRELRFALPSFTLQAWVKPSAHGGDIITRQVQADVYNYRLRLLADGRVEFRFTPGDLTADVVLAVSALHALPTNAWSHVAATFDDETGSMRIFLDGVQAASRTTLKRPAVNGVGPEWTRAGEGFAGMLDEVAIHDIAAPQSVLQSMLHGVAYAVNENLVSYYRFDDGTSAQWDGAAGGRHYGTSGMTNWWWGQVEEFASVAVVVGASTGDVPESISYNADWSQNWRNAGTLVGDVSMTNAPVDAPVQLSMRDSNEDGIPDWWYLAYGLDPNTTNSVAQADWDDDGINNYWEYRLGSGPYDAYSLDPEGLRSDAEYDSDGDGLPNLEEITVHGSDPTLWDTDNDGLSDGAEVERFHNPRTSLSPLTNRVLQLGGAATDYVLMSAATNRFALTDWVIEAWVNPDAYAAGEIIAREARPGLFNYRLGMQADGRPFVAFHVNTDLSHETLAATNALPTNTWTHVRGGYDTSTYTLYIEVNGQRHAREMLAGRVPVTRRNAAEQTRVGRGFNGMIDDVRIWSQMPITALAPALSHKRVGDSDILRYHYGDRAFMLRGNEPGLVSWLRFDDGIIAPATTNYPDWASNVVEDFADAAGDDPWLTHWRYHPRVQGGAAVVVAPDETPSNVMFVEDRDADGLPDWWQWQYWSDFDPYSGEQGNWSPLNDPDGDGLNNMSEFLASLNPRQEISGGSGLKDGLRDSDGDGLINLYEQNVSFTRVDLVDTDDDGLTDWEEVMGGRLGDTWVPFAPVPDAAGEWRKSDPLNPLSPLTHRSAQFDGAGRIVYEHQARHALRSWTLQAWIQAAAGAVPGDAVILQRRIDNSDYDAVTVNYELGLHTGTNGIMHPYVQMIGVQPETGNLFTNRVDGTQAGEVSSGVTPLDADEWVHLAATYSESREEIVLYVDGERISSLSGVKLPYGLGLVEDRDYIGAFTVGGGELIAGAVTKGFRGYIDDALVLSAAVTPDPYGSITDAIDRIIPALRTTSTGGTQREPLSIDAALALPHVPGELLVRFKHTVTPNDVNKIHAGRLGVEILQQYRIAPVYKVGVAEGVMLADKLAQLRADADVLYAEPNFIFQTMTAPDDSRYAEMWAMNNTGQTGGTEGADISAEAAWDFARGAADLRVAIIDTGIDYNHPDLVGNMWEGRGYDFHDGDDDPLDDDGHGTHVAGTVGAVGNNAVGVAGVAWQAELMAVRVLGGEGGTTANIVDGIQYAVENGARVSNNSYGGYGFAQAMYDAIEAAGNAGHLFVAAAGNDNNDNDGETPAYPASYDLPNIIAVAASDHNDARASFSNFGASSVDLAAPGVNILSTLPSEGYGTLSGTSMASPHVAGAAVVLMALNPGMTHAQIKDLILGNVDVLDPWDGLVLTGGRLNLGAAVGTPEDPGDPEDPAPLMLPVFYASFDDDGSVFDRGITLADHTMGNNWEHDWLHAGTPTNVVTTTDEFFNRDTDSNGDGIPDWWYLDYGLDPMTNSVAVEDWDLDGINNYWEYRLRSDPYDPYSLWKQWVAGGGDRTDGSMYRNDSQWDSDDEGLTNADEIQVYSTDPTRPDTDDDGLTDKEEIDRALDPLDSLMPYIMRYVRNESGVGAIEVPGNVRGKDNDGMRFNLEEWTLEATVRLAELPSVTGEPVILVSRRSKPYGNLTFELGIGTNDRAYVRYHGRDASQPEYRLESVAVMEAGTWFSVAGRLSHSLQRDRQQLDIFVDNHHDSRELSNAVNALGEQYGPLVMAAGLRGDIDEVRIWNVARGNDEIDRLRRRKLHFGEDVATMGVLNVNGGVLHRNFSTDIRLSNWTAELWFKTQSPGLLMERAAGFGDDGLVIYNYRLNINEEGTLEAQLSFNTAVGGGEGGFTFRWATVTLTAFNQRVDQGQWHFASLSFDGRDAILYLDGLIVDRLTIAPEENLPGLEVPYWHIPGGDGEPPPAYSGLPATMATQEGLFRAGLGMLGQLDEIRVFSAGSTLAQMDQRRFVKISPNEPQLVLYYDFDDINDLTADRVQDKANLDDGVGNLLGGAMLSAGAGVNAPIEYFPVQILAPKLAAYFPMDEGTYTRLDPERGFEGHQVKDFLRKLDFDFAGTFSEPDVYFMYNDESRDGLKYTQDYLAHTADWLADTYFITDADGDAMPDWWEVYYGLDANRGSTPDQPELGPHGDPDKDGLSNLSEFRAGLDPYDRDTTRSGFGDYDSRPSAFESTFGHSFDDGDRIADWWEVQYMQKVQVTLNGGLDPDHDDAHHDPDEDGWSNYAEFMTDQSPVDPREYPTPVIRFSARYNGRYGEDIGDVLSVTTISTNATGDSVTNVIGGIGGLLHLHFYDNPARDGFPTATAVSETSVTELREFESGYLREGMQYVFAFIDLDGDSSWSTTNEPAGIAEFHLGWGSWNEVEIPLTDDRQMRGFPRLRWDPVPEEERAVVTGYSVVAKDPRGGILFTRFIEHPDRAYMHEGDYLQAGTYGLGGDGRDGAYTFEIYKNESVYGLDFENFHGLGIAIVSNQVTQPPVWVSGFDRTYAYARNQISWTMDPNATWYQMTFWPDDGNGAADMSGAYLLQTDRRMVPYRDRYGNYTEDLPFHAGDVRPDGSVWTNGLYWVALTTGMQGGSSLSTMELLPFNLDVREPEETGGKSMIEGKLYYFGGHDFFSDAVRREGAVSNQMPVVVQSFNNPGFSGEPEAQVTIAPEAWINTEYRYEAAFQLKGLRRGSHYLRAFVDSNGNGSLDYWETWGYNRDLQTYYQPLRVSLESEGVMRVSDQMLIMRDRDTDGDGLPDIWEYDHYERNPAMVASSATGFLDLIGGDTPGENDLTMSARWQYGLDAFTAIAILDQNSNGIPDEWEIYYFGTLLEAGVASTDPDGDGMSIFEEYINGSDPLNPGDGLNLLPTLPAAGTPVLTWSASSGTVNYRVQYTDSLMTSWTEDSDLSHYSRLDIGGGAYTWTYTDPAPPVSGSRFYRVIIVPAGEGYP